ncbi:MAG TPA: hypothetical protein VF120_03030, partial [Ktedonobacterales bacterium]
MPRIGSPPQTQGRRIFTRAAHIVPRPRVHPAPQELTPDPRTAFLCALTADERDELTRLVHLNTVKASYYSELGSHEPIAWIVSPCAPLTAGYANLTARYTPLEWRELLADAKGQGLDLSTPEGWQALGR